MARAKPEGTARYVALRDVAIPAAEPSGQGRILLPGELVDLDADTAATLVRDGMVAPAEEGA